MSSDTQQRGGLSGEVSKLMREERWLDAIRLLKSRPELTNEDWKLSWNLGWSLFKLGEYRKSADRFRRVVVLRPATAATHWGLANALSELLSFA